MATPRQGSRPWENGRGDLGSGGLCARGTSRTSLPQGPVSPAWPCVSQELVRRTEPSVLTSAGACQGWQRILPGHQQRTQLSLIRSSSFKATWPVAHTWAVLDGGFLENASRLVPLVPQPQHGPRNRAGAPGCIRGLTGSPAWPRSCTGTSKGGKGGC